MPVAEQIRQAVAKLFRKCKHQIGIILLPLKYLLARLLTASGIVSVADCAVILSASNWLRQFVSVHPFPFTYYEVSHALSLPHC